jgi:hypothetical protein
VQAGRIFSASLYPQSLILQSPKLKCCSPRNRHFANYMTTSLTNQNTGDNEFPNLSFDSETTVLGRAKLNILNTVNRFITLGPIRPEDVFLWAQKAAIIFSKTEIRVREQALALTEHDKLVFNALRIQLLWYFERIPQSWEPFQGSWVFYLSNSDPYDASGNHARGLSLTDSLSPQFFLLYHVTLN